MSDLRDDRFAALAHDLAARIAAHSPRWTARPGGDPGTTLLEVLAFLGEELSAHADRLPAGSRERVVPTLWALADLAANQPADPATGGGVTVEVSVDGELWRPVGELAGAGPDDPVYVVEPDTAVVRFGDGRQGRRPPDGAAVEVTYRHAGRRRQSALRAWPFPSEDLVVELRKDGTMKGRTRKVVATSLAAPVRVRYFEGQLLSARDFATEQDYWRDKSRRHNRLLHGAGVIDGLAVSVAGDRVTIAPGVALDSQGRELVLPEPWSGSIPDTGATANWYLTIAYQETATDPVPGGDGAEPTRVREGVQVSFDSAPTAEGLTLARLVRSAGGWRAIIRS